MASTLTSRPTREQMIFIDAAAERNPGAGKAVAVREGLATWREWRRGCGGTPQAPRRQAAAPPGLAEAVAAAVSTAVATRKAARKAAKRARRATRESAPARPARQFTEAEAGTALRGMTRAELADVAGLAETGASPFYRAAPPTARTAASSVAEAAVAEAANPAGLAERLASGSPADLREAARSAAHRVRRGLRVRLAILGRERVTRDRHERSS